MRRMVLSLALLVAVGYQPVTTQMTEEQKAAIAAEVDSVVNERWVTLELAGTDIPFDAHDAPEWAWVLNGTVLLSKTAYDDYFGQDAGILRLQDVKVVDSRTVVLSPEIVLTIQRVRLIVVNVASYTPDEYVWRYAETLAWNKRNGEWKIILGHGSFPPESI